MKSRVLIALGIAAVGIVLFTLLLQAMLIGQWAYASLISVLALICVAIVLLPRLKELDLKNLRLTLAEIKQVKAEVEEIYSGISHLKRNPMMMDDAKMRELGFGEPEPGGLPGICAIMRYPAGCIKRERERLARIFVKERPFEKIAEAILDDSLDEKVFKWNGPEVGLDVPPKSHEEREREKKEKEKQQ